MFPIVGLHTFCKEGPLGLQALRSTRECGFDVVVFEGPAGAKPEGPITDYETFDPRMTVHYGTWESDAAKRTAIVRYVQKNWKGPVWGVWVDGDEVLCNGRYLPDVLQWVEWNDDGKDAPTAGVPILKVEGDGSVATCLSNVIRVDLIDAYEVSSSVIRFKNGGRAAVGNVPYSGKFWREERAQYPDLLFVTPPIPCEPYLMHRSWLRHPDRQGSRLHVAEEEELRRLGLLQVGETRTGPPTGPGADPVERMIYDANTRR